MNGSRVGVGEEDRVPSGKTQSEICPVSGILTTLIAGITRTGAAAIRAKRKEAKVGLTPRDFISFPAFSIAAKAFVLFLRSTKTAPEAATEGVHLAHLVGHIVSMH